MSKINKAFLANIEYQMKEVQENMGKKEKVETRAIGEGLTLVVWDKNHFY